MCVRPGAYIPVFVIITFPQALGDCIITNRDLIGFSVGLFSTCCWMCAQLPCVFFLFVFLFCSSATHQHALSQIFKNYRLQSAEGLSPLFLVIWFLGDFSNLGGCLLGNLLSDTPVCLSTQTVQAVYFLIIDVILCAQWIWYSKLLRSKPPKDDQDPLIEQDNVELSLVGDGDGGGGGGGGRAVAADEAAVAATTAQTSSDGPSNNNTAAATASLLVLLPLVLFSFTLHLGPTTVAAAAAAGSRSLHTRTLLEDDGFSSGPENTTAIVFSQIVAWVSTVMYLSSRIPQIVRNVRGPTFAAVVCCSH